MPKHLEQPLPVPASRAVEQPFRVQGLPTASFLRGRGKAVVTFGVFDGMHRGHQAILQQVISSALVLGVPSVAVIFRPRPIEALEIAPPRPYLTAADRTARLIRSLGVTYVGILRFTRELALMPADEFLQRLDRRLPMLELWMGADATLGRGPKGTLPSVQRIGAEIGFDLRIFSPGEQLPTTSSVLDELDARDLDSAVLHLGRGYELPAFVDPAFSAEGGAAQFFIHTPERLYVPPDGCYVVLIHPAAFGPLQPHADARPGRAAVVITTSRSSLGSPRLILIGDAAAKWAGSFVRVEFLATLELSPRELLQSAMSWPERPAGEDAGNGRSARIDISGREQLPHPPSRS